MKALFLLANSTCDIQCKYCFYTTGYEKRSKDRIRPEVARHVAYRIASTGFDTVILTGGDPLHSLFKHETYVLIGELKSKGCKVIVNTSAAFLTDEDIDIIIALGVDRVDISIDSHDVSVHDAQRGRHADAVRIVTGLIKREYRPIVTTTVATLRNAPTLKETILWLRSLGVGDTRIQHVFSPIETEDENDVIIDSMRACLSLLSAAHARDYLDLIACTLRNETSQSGPTCRMGKEYFVCNASGVVTPCFHRPDLVLGNLFSDPVDVLVRSLKRHELIEYTLPSCFGRHCTSLFDNPKFWRGEKS